MNIKEAIVRNLDDYVRKGIFPIIEAEAVSEYKKPAEMLPIARKVKGIMASYGLENLQILQEGASYPAVFGEVHSSNPHAPTILVQGHYDGQSSDAEKWTKTKPHKPVVLSELGENRIYGRGASDDWGQVMTHLAAVDVHRKMGEPLSANLKFLIEGGEEQGSRDMDKVIEKQKHLLSCDVVVITDSGPGREGHPVITTIARGLAAVRVSLTTGTGAAHSGENIQPNAFAELAALLTSMKDYQTGRILIPGFHENMKQFSAEERGRLNQMPFDTDLFKRIYGLRRIVVEEGFTPQETMWIRPSYEIHLIDGGIKGNSIPYATQARVTMRLPVGADPHRADELFRQELYHRAAKLSIHEEQLRVELEHAAYAFSTTTDHPFFKAREQALERAFNASVDYMGIGGTEPIAVYHQQILGVPVIFDAVNTPSDHYHGNDESFSIEKSFLPGIMANVLFYQNMARVKRS